MMNAGSHRRALLWGMTPTARLVAMALLAWLFATNAAFAQPGAASGFSWQAARSGSDAVDMGAWTINGWGPLGDASATPFRSADGREKAVKLRLQSADQRPPPANAVHPLDLKAGRVYRITLELQATEATQVEVMVRRQGFPYDSTMTRTIDFKGEGWRSVSFATVWTNEGAVADLRIATPRPLAEVLVRRLVVADEGPLPFGSVPTAPFSAKMLGMHVNELGKHSVWPRFNQGLLRLWDTYTTWNELAPSREAFLKFDSNGWRRLDAYVAYAQAGDPRASILYVLGEPPKWASTSPNAKCPYGEGSCGAPATMEVWREYVRTLALRYKGKIRYWELWNEVDQPQFFTGGQSLVEMARAAREELKAVDPANTLFSASYTIYGIKALEDFLHQGGGAYVDGIAAHWYYGAEPEKIAGQIFNVKELMRAYGVADKPLWNTEGAPICEARRNGRCVIGDLPETEVEALVARALLTMSVNGVTGYAYYFLEGMQGGVVRLFDSDRKEVTSGGRQFAAFSRWMMGGVVSGLDSFGDRGHLLTVERGKDSFRIAWSQAASELLQVPSDVRSGFYQPLGGAWRPVPADGMLRVGRIPVVLSRSRW